MKKMAWWQKEVVYQIYPRSFQDSNADGIGDLPGITSRLDYLKGLGINAFWISPFYPSPMYDFGYDVSDYKDIHPIFGTMKDFDTLLKEAHKRNMKLIIDLVPNHTSSEHPWFLESKKSKNNPMRDFYIWKDPAPNGGVPNNWLSYFGGSSWEYDSHTKQYYLHQFVKQQPDLNYHNQKVLEEMLEIIDFWMKKGVDGIRVDVMPNLWKDPKYPDEKENPNWDGKLPFERLERKHYSNTDGVHKIIKKFREVLDKYDDRAMIGETYLPIEDLVKYYGKNDDECHLAFNFHLIEMPWNAKKVKAHVDAYDKILPEGCWPSYVLGNHDRKRVVTRVGGEKQARIGDMLLLTLRGSPTVYYGGEIGMANVKIPKEMIQDPPAINMPEVADEVGRDPVRTPMQWDSSENAGFSPAGVKTWLPVSDDYKTRNVACLEKDKRSILNLFKKLMKLRSENEALYRGKYKSIPTKYSDLFVYTRFTYSQRFLIVLNFSSKKSFTLNLSKKIKSQNAEIVVATDMKTSGKIDLLNLKIRADDGFVIKLD